ncbi:MAG: DUF983 domain-containing protein [Rhizorhabdus sp.]|jgi:uncharacterized protein (DUF983 family)|nr:MAG: DUF983 domain-containing protein [Rhizorhabdus sp.]
MADAVPEAPIVWPKLEPIRTGIAGRCPRCGEGRLFAGLLTLAKGCDQCGLSYDFADPADGPAFFVICFGCVPAVVFALMLEIWWSASWLTQLLVTGPVLLATCLAPLRPLKGWLVCSQYFFKAGEGRINRPWKPYGANGPTVMPGPSRRAEGDHGDHGGAAARRGTR